MADFVFLPTVHFTKGDIVPVGLKDRIVSVPFGTPHRPDNLTSHNTREHFVFPIRPGKHKRAAKPGVSWEGCFDGF